MLRISKLSDYAIVLLSELAVDRTTSATARSLADATRLSQPTVVKLLKILTRQGVLSSAQGRNGGYALARSPGDITLAEIIEAVDGPIAMSECNRDESACGIESNCGTRTHWLYINSAVRQALTAISLRDLIAPPAQIKPITWRRPETAAYLTD
jgi:FeS assembly SUF system regulator